MSTAQLTEKTSTAPSDERVLEIHTFCTFRNAMLPQCNTEAGEGKTGPPAPKQGLLSIVELLSQRHYTIQACLVVDLLYSVLHALSARL